MSRKCCSVAFSNLTPRSFFLVPQGGYVPSNNFNSEVFDIKLTCNLVPVVPLAFTTAKDDFSLSCVQCLRKQWQSLRLIATIRCADLYCPVSRKRTQADLETAAEDGEWRVGLLGHCSRERDYKLADAGAKRNIDNVYILPVGTILYIGRSTPEFEATASTKSVVG